MCVCVCVCVCARGKLILLSSVVPNLYKLQSLQRSSLVAHWLSAPGDGGPNSIEVNIFPSSFFVLQSDDCRLPLNQFMSPVSLVFHTIVLRD